MQRTWHGAWLIGNALEMVIWLQPPCPTLCPNTAIGQPMVVDTRNEWEVGLESGCLLFTNRGARQLLDVGASSAVKWSNRCDHGLVTVRLIERQWDKAGKILNLVLDASSDAILLVAESPVSSSLLFKSVFISTIPRDSSNSLCGLGRSVTSSYFTNKQIESQKGQVSCLSLHSRPAA